MQLSIFLWTEFMSRGRVFALSIKIWIENEVGMKKYGRHVDVILSHGLIPYTNRDYRRLEIGDSPNGRGSL